MFNARANRTQYLCFNVGILLGLGFSLNSAAYANPGVQEVEHLKQAAGKASTTATLSKKEIEAKNQEQERVYVLGLKIMENFGCSDYTDLGLKALVSYLRDPKRTRVSFTPQEHARILTGHFSLLNYTEKTDTPESKIRNSSKGYSEAFRTLSKILNQDLYLSYGKNTDLAKIADDLDNPRSQYGAHFKKKIRDALNELNKYSSIDHFNVGCRIKGTPKDNKKNKLLVQLKEKDASGKYIKVHLDEYMKRDTKKKDEVVDSTIKRKKEEAKPQAAPTTAPKSAPAPTHTTPAKPKEKVSTPAPKPAPTPAPKPAPTPAPKPAPSTPEGGSATKGIVETATTASRANVKRFIDVDYVNYRFRNSSVLKGKGDKIIAAAEKHGLDPVFFVSIIAFETGWGSSYMVRVRKNPGGVYDSKRKEYFSYDTIEEGLDHMASNLRTNYINRGIYSIRAIAAKYAPVGASNDPKGNNGLWPGEVVKNMNTFIKGSIEQQRKKK